METLLLNVCEKSYLLSFRSCCTLHQAILLLLAANEINSKWITCLAVESVMGLSCKVLKKKKIKNLNRSFITNPALRKSN